MASICSAESLETKTSHKTWRTSTTWRNQNLNIHEQSQIPKFPTGHFWWPDFSWLSTVLPGLATPRAPLPGKTSKRQNVNQSEPPKNMICGECRWISWNRETHFQSLSGVGRPLKWQHLRLSLELFHTSCRQTGVSFLGYLNMLSILRHLPVKSSPLFSQLEPGCQQSKLWSKRQQAHSEILYVYINIHIYTYTVYVYCVYSHMVTPLQDLPMSEKTIISIAKCIFSESTNRFHSTLTC